MSALYVVATPIGNLEDITLRALRVLGEAALILAEDTRRTRVLLDRHGIAARPSSLHAHNEAARSEAVLARLAAGESVALVSDAGTPLVSDPGERLCAAVIAAGHPVVPVPGPSAVLAALMGAGLPAASFAFLGFPPRKRGARQQAFAAWRARPETLVLFESPRRIAATLADLHEALGDRPAAVARELTKRHEEWLRGTLASLAEALADGARGEVTLVVAGADPATRAERPSPQAVDAAIRTALAEGASARDAASTVAADTGVPRREVYARVLALQDAPTGSDR